MQGAIGETMKKVFLRIDKGVSRARAYDSAYGLGILCPLDTNGTVCGEWCAWFDADDEFVTCKGIPIANIIKEQKTP